MRLGVRRPSHGTGLRQTDHHPIDWASANVVTSVAKLLMEQGYGYSVTTVPSSTSTALTSVAETGTPDILTEL